MTQNNKIRGIDEVNRGIDAIYNDVGMMTATGEVLDRYLDNYKTKCGYHEWLLGDRCDKTVLEINKSDSDIKYDFINYIRDFGDGSSLSVLINHLTGNLTVNEQGRVVLSNGQKVIRWLKKLNESNIPSDLMNLFNSKYQEVLDNRKTYLSYINKNNARVIRDNPHSVIGVTYTSSYFGGCDHPEGEMFKRWGEPAINVHNLPLPFTYQTYCKTFKLKPVANAKTRVKNLLNSTTLQDFIAYLEKYDQATTFKIELSATPEDFITASHNTTGWRSCFAPDGEYHASINAFYPITGMLIAKIVAGNGRAIGRRWVYVDKERHIVSTGLEYGSFSDEMTTKLREHIQHKMKTHFDFPDEEYKWYRRSYSSKEDFDGVYLDEGWDYSHFTRIGSDHDTVDFLADYCYEGLDAYNCISDGYWDNGERSVCYECGERYHSDDMYWVDSVVERICSHCCVNHYNYDELHEEYTSYDVDAYRTHWGDMMNTTVEWIEDNCVFLEDLEIYAEDAYHEHSDGLYYSYEEELKEEGV